MRYLSSVLSLVSLLAAAAGCGDDEDHLACETPPAEPQPGSATGHAAPLGSGPTEARAGRLAASDLPAVSSPFLTWAPGDFVLANDKIALVIEDVGDSELYDPWGGRPVGIARVSGGQLVEAPENFGEIFLLTGRSTIVTRSVSVLADGSAGGPAIVRTIGRMAPIPFLEGFAAALFPDATLDFTAAIDYVLEPGAEHVDVVVTAVSPRGEDLVLDNLVHVMMGAMRMPSFAKGVGFTAQPPSTDLLGFIDDDSTSWAYMLPEGRLEAGVSLSGLVSLFQSATVTFPACQAIERTHARIVIGGPGLDGLLEAVARDRGEAQREITGTVTRGGAPAPGVRVHATDTSGIYLTRTTSDGSGQFRLHVPATAAVELTAFRRGDAIGMASVAAAETAATIALPANGSIHVTTVDGGPGPAMALPSRIQVLPAGSSVVPELPATFGEPRTVDHRLDVVYATDGEATIEVPTGQWEVVVSRGYEYELHRQTVTVTAGATVAVDAILDRVVDTTGVQCGDFHVHTIRSVDSGDDELEKVRQAVAEGVELPIRSDHEHVGSFAPQITALGVEAFAKGIPSFELTSMVTWGHMGVFPLTPDPEAINTGAPRWQTWPTPASPDTPVAAIPPLEVFAAIRARPEQPILIINHPRLSSSDYFAYVGLDPDTGMPTRIADWDPEFTVVEFFRSTGWQENRQSTVRDWIGLLRSGRRVFATGSSDSHEMYADPIGYPRTCLEVGTDDPQALTDNQVRDTLAAGHSSISGGIYVTAAVGTAGPGDTATGVGTTTNVDIEIQAASWVDVDELEVIVDGVSVDTIAIMPGDAVPGAPQLRWRGQVAIDVADAGSFVIVAAYGDAPLEPLHPRRIPFGVSNPIFVTP